MVIHNGVEGFVIRLARTDNGSDVDAITQEAVTALGRELRPNDGIPLSLVNGDNFYPEGEIDLEWHVLEGERTYTTRFFVLSINDSRDFDVILGSETLERLKVVSFDTHLWSFRRSGGVASEMKE